MWNKTDKISEYYTYTLYNIHVYCVRIRIYIHILCIFIIRRKDKHRARRCCVPYVEIL